MFCEGVLKAAADAAIVEPGDPSLVEGLSLSDVSDFDSADIFKIISSLDENDSWRSLSLDTCRIYSCEILDGYSILLNSGWTISCNPRYRLVVMLV